MRLPSLPPANWLALLLALSPCWAQANPSLKQPGFQTRATTVEAEAEVEVEQKPRHQTGATESTTTSSNSHCSADHPQYPKTLLVSRLANSNANLNSRLGLRGIEQALPSRLGRELTSRGALTLFREIDRELGRGSDNAELIRQAALQTDTQLVLSGDLISTSGPDRNRGLVTAGRDALVAGLKLAPDWDSRQRQFVLALRLHQGLTGNLLWHQIYNTQGVWRDSQAPTSGQFQSPAFGDSHYGAQVEALLEEALADLSEAIRCQPLIGWLDDRGSGTQPLLALGRRQGLTPGDELRVYHLQKLPIASRYRSYRFLPRNTGYRVRVQEAQADQIHVEWLNPGPRPGRYLVITPSSEAEPQTSEGELASEDD